MISKDTLLFLLLFSLRAIATAQIIDTSKYIFLVDTTTKYDRFFTGDLKWRGADGASSIDIGNGKIVWLFSDGFICKDSSRLRKNSIMIRNSIAIQENYEIKNARLNYYWKNNGNTPQSFFTETRKHWYWTGHGAMVKDKLLIFLMKMRASKSGLGFEAFDWCVALISNPQDNPNNWKIKFIEGPPTYGLIAGSAAVMKDEKYLYAYGAVEPSTHEVYVLRWDLEKAYAGDLTKPRWWINNKWEERASKDPAPQPLFIGGTEFSVHYDSQLKKYIQIQSHGFGEATIGIRMADSVQGPWTNPHQLYKPNYIGIKKPFMYAAKAHPEIIGEGLHISYNVNSFDFAEMVENENLYFPKFIRIKIIEKRQNN